MGSYYGLPNVNTIQEKREFARFDVTESCFVYINNSDSMFFNHGKVINISTSGMLIECECSFAEIVKTQGQFIIMNFINNDKTQEIINQGKVVRIEKGRSPSTYIIGVKFIRKLSNRFWTILKKYYQFRVVF